MSYKADAMTIADLMRDIKNYYLPAIQREFVWDSEKIEALFDSILRGYPIGTLLIWDVREPAIHDFQFYELIRNYDVRHPHNIKSDLSSDDRCWGILDGQQRITSLYIGLKGTYVKKLTYLWWNNPAAFPETRLYINLLYEPKPDSDQRFQIKFLSDQQARNTPTAYWFRIGDILLYETQGELRTFRRSTEHKDNDVFEDNLEALWNAIHKFETLSYFSERRQELDEVLSIFVRLNTGGTPLSYSDLLLSLATATWKRHDAREAVYGLVEDLNKDYGPFNFSKDFVLKTLLVLNDGPVGFRAANVRRKASLEDIWDKVASSLKVTVHLLSSFCFNGQTLTAPNAVIPIAYYVNKRNLTDSFAASKHYEAEREIIRIWLLKMLLTRVFSGQSDQVLSGVRQVIQDALEAQPPATAFPADAIYQYVSARGIFVFTDESIESIIRETSYGDPFAFFVLSILFPNLNFHHTLFHIDHMHPQAHFTRQKLKASGMSTDDIDFAAQRRDRISNLHFLPGPDNISKNDTPLAQWLSAQPNPALVRTLSLIPETDLALSNFRQFYELRKQDLISALKARLGVVATIPPPDPNALPDPESLVTGQAADG